MRISLRREAITCRHAVELITDYLEDALPARQRRDLERHLSQCPHCSEYLAQLRVTIDVAGRLDSDELSPDVRQTLIQLYRQTRQ